MDPTLDLGGIAAHHRSKEGGTGHEGISSYVAGSNGVTYE